MLSDKEKEGCKTILNKLSQQDLITLTDTVTNRLVSPENASGKVLISFQLVLYMFLYHMAAYLTCKADSYILSCFRPLCVSSQMIFPYLTRILTG